MKKGEMVDKVIISGMNALAGITGVMGKNKSEERREDTEMLATTTATVGSVTKGVVEGMQCNQSDLEMLKAYTSAKALDDMRETVKNSESLSEEEKLEKQKEILEEERKQEAQASEHGLKKIKTVAQNLAMVIGTTGLTIVSAIYVVKMKTSIDHVPSFLLNDGGKFFKNIF